MEDGRPGSPAGTHTARTPHTRCCLNPQTRDKCNIFIEACKSDLTSPTSRTPARRKLAHAAQMQLVQKQHGSIKSRPLVDEEMGEDADAPQCECSSHSTCRRPPFRNAGR